MCNRVLLLEVKKLDLYILKKFLGTYFFIVILIILIVIVFDLVEKMDDFMESQAPLKAIVFDYYLNLLPYYANMLSPLLVFISVIFFTSKMASQTEIIAILSSGVSFIRSERVATALTLKNMMAINLCRDCMPKQLLMTR